MKLFLTLFSFLILTTIFSCSSDDNDNEMMPCSKEVTFQAGGTEICATGTYLVTTTSFTSTNISLQGDNDEVVLINLLGGAPGQYAIPPGNASYVDQTGKTFTSIDGGRLTITSIDGTLSGSFNFSAQAATDNEVVMITTGSIVGLPSR